MNTKTLSLILFVLVWILNACSPASVAIPSEELPAPVIAGEGYQALQIDDVHVEVGVGSQIPVHVNVKGRYADFKLENGSSTASLRTADMPVVKDDIQVDSVNVEVGAGSPIPVKAIVSGNLPLACAQLGEIRVHRQDTSFFVQLVAYLPAQTDCAEDSIPFRLEIPLNIVNLPAGPYNVNVNGATATFDPRTVPASQ